MRAHEDGHPDSMVGTGNWTIRMRTRWQGRAPERETRELLGKVMRAAGKWTREPMRSWVTRQGKGWREGAEGCLIRAERAWESGEEDVIRETGEALAKVRRALRTLAGIEATQRMHWDESTLELLELLNRSPRSNLRILARPRGE